MKKCMCGCGKTVNPGRSFVHGHNQKNKVILRVNHTTQLKVKRKPVRKPQSPASVLVRLLQKRQTKIGKFIKALREVY